MSRQSWFTSIWQVLVLATLLPTLIHASKQHEVDSSEYGILSTILNLPRSGSSFFKKFMFGNSQISTRKLAGFVPPSYFDYPISLLSQLPPSESPYPSFPGYYSPPSYYGSQPPSSMPSSMPQSYEPPEKYPMPKALPDAPPPMDEPLPPPMDEPLPAILSISPPSQITTNVSLMPPTSTFIASSPIPGISTAVTLQYSIVFDGIELATLSVENSIGSFSAYIVEDIASYLHLPINAVQVYSLLPGSVVANVQTIFPIGYSESQALALLQQMTSSPTAVFSDLVTLYKLMNIQISNSVVTSPSPSSPPYASVTSSGAEMTVGSHSVFMLLISIVGLVFLLL